MKGQAALEFLMTYGWAILIVIAVVAALYAMGVFKLPTGGLGRISPPFPPGAGVAYEDHNADALVLVVGSKTIDNVKVYVYDMKSGLLRGIATTNQPGPYNPGTRIKFTNSSITGLFSGDVNITVEYTDVNSGLSHTDSAGLHGA